MNNNCGDKDITKKQALDFLVCCYFGQSKNLIKAAIDRGYVDMASHTLQGFENYNTKWEWRYNASVKISNSIINYPNDSHAFSAWHETLINSIEESYSDPKLSRGQSQKWLNMSIKYLFVFKQLYGKDDERLKKIDTFLTSTDVNDYKVPIDSYVLKGAGVDDVSWSKLDSEKYEEINKIILDRLNGESGFEWEFQNWETLAENIIPDTDSYARYYNGQIEKANQDNK